jgi:C_GCAxxG_C_C family probable redox protein
MSDAERMLELRGQRFYCSQVVMQLALDLQGRDDPALVRAMEGLAGGLGFTGELCGTLTSGAAVLGLFAGRGRASDDEDPSLVFMTEDLVRWFGERFGEAYGGIRCREILAGDPGAQATRCPEVIAGTFHKVKELLVENGFDLAGDPDRDD